MKYTLLFFLSIFSIIACTKNEATDEGTAHKEVVKSLEEKIEDHISKELESGERNDTIVLDFKFGMSRQQLYQHTKKLYRQKKMYPIQKSKKR